MARPHANARDPDRVLKVGYVSGDFRKHSVAYFFEPLLEAHDRARVHVTCYSTATVEDEVTARLKSRADAWCDVAQFSDEQAAEMIRADGIDVLVDLSGHSGLNRLLIFARRPAPVQVTYLGYPGTTGMGAIGYRITDGLADPPGMTESLYAEKLFRVPGCAWCYRPDPDSPGVGELPAARTGNITFGSFNRVGKIGAGLIELWAGILSEVSGSRLLMKSEWLGERMAQSRLLEAFAKHGIGQDRLEMVGRTKSTREHLEMYGRVDLALDSFPYNGTTTTCEAMWMGVPVITLAGSVHHSRVGLSLVNAAGLPELAAANPREYVEKTVELAKDIPRLRELRRTLRQCMASSVLMDATRLARDIEMLYRGIWHAWCEA
jgi:protein O-GlcNAc transferase